MKPFMSQNFDKKIQLGSYSDFKIMIFFEYIFVFLYICSLGGQILSADLKSHRKLFNTKRFLTVCRAIS